MFCFYNDLEINPGLHLSCLSDVLNCKKSQLSSSPSVDIKRSLFSLCSTWDADHEEFGRKCARYRVCAVRIQENSGQQESRDYVWTDRNRKRGSVLHFPELEILTLTSRTALQISDGSSSAFKEAILNFVKESCILVCLVSKEILFKNFHIKSALIFLSITTFMILNIVKYKDRNSYKLVVV